MWLLLLPVLLQADSAAALERAREAQAGFERFRIAHLPRVYGASHGRCDEIVGRFCFWHDREEEEDSWEPPPEPAQIGAARKRLIGVLDSAARLLPGDDWIAGQLVRYLVEDRRAEEAIAAASRCRGTGWWCSALLGYALHRAGQFARAESAFGAALEGMPEVERCAWEDLSLLLDGSYGFYRKAGCRERRALEARIWWLADPFFSVPGNERRTEHLARRVMDRMQEGSRSAYGLRWGSDLRELLIRYGWPVAWARDESASRSDPSRLAIVAYNQPRGRRFMPPAEVAVDPRPGAGERWELKPDLPRSTYAVPYAKRMESVEAQLVAFLRGDSSVVVAAYDLSIHRRERAGRGNWPAGAGGSWPAASGNGAAELGNGAAASGSWLAAESGKAAGEIEAALVIGVGPEESPLIARQRGEGDRGVLAAVYPGRAALASLELLSRGDSTAYRFRRWLALPVPGSGIALSELLLFGAPAGDSVPRTLEEVLPLVLGAARVVEGEGVGVYWEIYSPGSGEVSVAVSASREAGFLARVGAALGIGSRRRDVVRLRWSDRVAGSRPLPGAVWLALPGAESGDYTLVVEVRDAIGASASAVKKFRVEKR